MCILMHAHTHTHTQTHARIHTHYKHTVFIKHTHAHKHTHMRTHTHTCTHTYTHTLMHIMHITRMCVRTQTHTHTDTYMHTHTHTHMYTCIYTGYTCAHAHTHTNYTWKKFLFLSYTHISLQLSVSTHTHTHTHTHQHISTKTQTSITQLSLIFTLLSFSLDFFFSCAVEPLADWLSPAMFQVECDSWCSSQYQAPLPLPPFLWWCHQQQSVCWGQSSPACYHWWAVSGSCAVSLSQVEIYSCCSVSHLALWYFLSRLPHWGQRYEICVNVCYNVGTPQKIVWKSMLCRVTWDGRETDLKQLKQPCLQAVWKNCTRHLQ